MANEKNLGHMSIDPMTGETVFVKPGEESPAEKRERQKKEIISRLRQYVSDHSNGPLKEETDPMVKLCNDAADMLQATAFKERGYLGEVKLESIINRKRIDRECFKTIKERMALQEQWERECARDLVHDVLCSGLVVTGSSIDPMTNDLLVSADMIVGVRNGEDVNDMLMKQRDYEKYHKEE